MRQDMNQQVMQILTQMNQQYENLQEQIKVIEQQLLELQYFREELNILSSKENSSILAPLGKSVFAPVVFSSSEKVFVEVGAGYFVKKNLHDAKLVVEEQTKKFHEFKAQLSAEVSSLTVQLEQMFSTMQNTQ
ncbi:prefoldin subunit alpha [Candidatus Pacearchaeota archaeon]|nr:prefoldin subunit alpha [Candidatus Pacearchaeota archaeon]